MRWRAPYADLDATLRELVARARSELGERFVAAYLIGSFAIGDFDSHSDVDFLVAVADEIPIQVVAALQAMHGRIHSLDSPWAKRLDGSYVPTRILRRRDPARTPLLYLDNGSPALVPSPHCNTMVARWMARERGITLAGPDAASMIDPIQADALRDEAAASMRLWAREIRSHTSQMNNRWYQPYAVLGYCRMLYTLRTGSIASKPAAARWARGALDPRWSPLIARALEQRPDPSLRARQAAEPRDFDDTLAFIDHAVELAIAADRRLPPPAFREPA